MLVFQDIMVIDRSVLYGVPEEDDMHEDMRLDVDNMSYEVTLQKISTLQAWNFWSAFLCALYKDSTSI